MFSTDQPGGFLLITRSLKLTASVASAGERFYFLFNLQSCTTRPHPPLANLDSESVPWHTARTLWLRIPHIRTLRARLVLFSVQRAQTHTPDPCILALNLAHLLEIALFSASSIHNPKKTTGTARTGAMRASCAVPGVASSYSTRTLLLSVGGVAPSLLGTDFLALGGTRVASLLASPDVCLSTAQRPHALQVVLGAGAGAGLPTAPRSPLERAFAPPHRLPAPYYASYTLLPLERAFAPPHRLPAPYYASYTLIYTETRSYGREPPHAHVEESETPSLSPHRMPHVQECPRMREACARGLWSGARLDPRESAHRGRTDGDEERAQEHLWCRRPSLRSKYAPGDAATRLRRASVREVCLKRGSASASIAGHARAQGVMNKCQCRYSRMNQRIHALVLPALNPPMSNYYEVGDNGVH
ncbi:hypothetical protein FB451DRAFT_1533787 [Mycena latifolia]|nr:hypothetical protein FB451DRAFT_1533787 [Mycena latifolia]